MEVLGLLSVNIAVFSRIVKTAEDVRYAYMEKYDPCMKACTSTTARFVAVPPKFSASMVRSASSSSAVESHLDSMHKKRKREGKAIEA